MERMCNLMMCFSRVYVVFGNVVQDYDRASSENMMTVMETCNDVNLSNLPLRYELTQPFIIDWCKMNVSNPCDCISGHS